MTTVGLDLYIPLYVLWLLDQGSAPSMVKEVTAMQTKENEETVPVPIRCAPEGDQGEARIKVEATFATADEDFLVTFAEPVDSENPRDWSSRKKWAVTGVMSATGFNRITVSSIMAPALITIGQDLEMNEVESVMSMSVYLLATAFGPLVIGPLSEVYGRKPILHATNVWFLVWNLVCGFAHTKGVLIAARLLAGFGAGAVYVLAGGVLGDVWRPEQRGKSLGLYSLVPLLGAAVGPIVGGAITQNTRWRWMFWATSILQGGMVVASIPLFSETYAPLILERRAARLRATTGDGRFHTSVGKLGQGRSPLWVLQRSLSRPIRLLLFHPIVQVQTLLSGFAYGITYLVLSTYATLWTTKYHDSVETSGLHYIALCIGEIAGAQMCGPLMDVVFRKLQKRASHRNHNHNDNSGRGGDADAAAGADGGVSGAAAAAAAAGVPEYHIPMMLPGTILTVTGLLVYGWTAQARVVWVVVDIGAVVLCCGMQFTNMSLQAYVIDSYPVHTSSAAAAAQFLRSLTAFAFPLFAPDMYTALGYGWANTLIALVSAAITVPAAGLIWVYGAKLRARAMDSY